MTDPASVAGAAAQTGNVAILINNAGSSTGASLLTGDLADVRLELDFFGTLAVTRAFAPLLAAQQRSAVLAEIIADEISRRVLVDLSSGVSGLYPQLA